MADGNFILEAARYLGYDKDAEEGLRTMWTRQQSTGQLIGAAGLGHWKDTGIPLYALVRQCELGQDWSLLHELEPQVVHAIAFLRSLQVRAKQEDSALGRYGLLPKGNSDGGIGGDRDEFANTLLVMFGLKAIARAGEQQKIGSRILQSRAPRDAPPRKRIRISAHVIEERPSMGVARSLGQTASAIRAVGIFSCHFPRPHLPSAASYRARSCETYAGCD